MNNNRNCAEIFKYMIYKWRRLQPYATTKNQQKESIPQWHNLVDKKLILKQGLIDKRKVIFWKFGLKSSNDLLFYCWLMNKGLFSRRRMFLLTMGPNLYYVDPSNMVLKGQVPFGLTLKAEPKNFKNLRKRIWIGDSLVMFRAISRPLDAYFFSTRKIKKLLVVVDSLSDYVHYVKQSTVLK